MPWKVGGGCQVHQSISVGVGNRTTYASQPLLGHTELSSMKIRDGVLHLFWWKAEQHRG